MMGRKKRMTKKEIEALIQQAEMFYLCREFNDRLRKKGQKHPWTIVREGMYRPPDPEMPPGRSGRR